MKKMIGLVTSLVIIYSVYYDLTVGVLPSPSAHSLAKEETFTKISEGDHLFTKKIQPGDTVISILEEHQQGKLPVSIEQIVTDFERLNKGMKPEEIQSGKTYKFPIYQQKSE